MQNSHPRDEEVEHTSDEEEHEDHHDRSEEEVPPEFGEPVQKVMLLYDLNVSSNLSISVISMCHLKCNILTFLWISLFYIYFFGRKNKYNYLKKLSQIVQ